MASDFPPTLKVTSSGSQYSVSTSGYVTVPNPTPRTEAAEVVDPPPEIDFQAMTKTLATIAEGLNESAEEAMFPSPPINTPVITSPAASVTYQHPKIRSRGMSTIGDRLARAVAEGRKFYHDSDVSTSDSSVRSSLPTDDESDSMSDVLSDGGRDRHNIPIALGSPRANPMGLISFTSNDLDDRRPAPFNSTEAFDGATRTGIGSGSVSPDSTKSAATGVTEMSTWKEEVEGRFERALKSLENLARDEHNLDSSKPMDYYYEAHLKRLLGAHKRKFPTSVGLMQKPS
ncbi:hypothetical protein C7974DRAFT_382181 [Boeremia exigua]|uniref:uncharacterized protein n=1 Tax=Boeremia exigua TaxID=749465 RepID=UPI001E8D1359|nr:uncharacterized protein C7974DRAFT_382181 [Boeremia exigua]KAH6643771.1 hypothetical protein C7974DRAFT_382181 [Boeremia exigua]